MQKNSFNKSRMLGRCGLLVTLAIIFSFFPAFPVTVEASTPISGAFGWGVGSSGELGTGTNISSSSMALPTRPPAGAAAGFKFTALSAGAFFSLGKGNDGKLYAWGDGEYGQLGNGTSGANLKSNLPLPVNNPAGTGAGFQFTSFISGYNFSLALGNDGKLYAWGDNSNRELCNGTGGNFGDLSAVPVPVSSPAGVGAGFGFTVFFSGTAFNLLLGNDGKAYACGYNYRGQLGTGNNNDSNVPVAVVNPTGVAAGFKFITLMAGDDQSLGLGNDNKLYAWGNNFSGQLGNNTTTSSNIPGPVNTPAGVGAGFKFTALSGGPGYSVALGSDGNVYGWGVNGFGELGQGTLDNGSLVPIPVKHPAGVAAGFKYTSVSAEYASIFAFGNEGKLYAWGYDAAGQLGDGADNTFANGMPGLIDPPINYKIDAVFPGTTSYHTLVLMSSLGQPNPVPTVTGFDPAPVVATGWPQNLQVEGTNFIFDSIVRVGGVDQPTTYISSHLLTIELSGAQLAAPGSLTVTVNNPTPGGGTSNSQVVSLVAPSQGTYGWGDNGDGALGTNSVAVGNVPQPIFNPAGAAPDFKYSLISPSSTHTLGLGNDGNLYAWGENLYGQLGYDGPASFYLTPVPVNKPAGAPAGFQFTQISVDFDDNSYALGSDGKLYGWGSKFNESTIPTALPNPPGVPAGFTFSTIGSYLELGNNGVIYTWGSGSSPTFQAVSNPAGVGAGFKFVSFTTVGSTHYLAMGNDNKLYAWGNNTYGEIGNGTTGSSVTVPVPVNNPAGVGAGFKFTAYTTTTFSSLALGNDGKLYAWGVNGGEFGNGQTAESHVPIPVNNPSGSGAGFQYTALAGGNSFVQALGNDGTVYAWGDNVLSELGNNAGGNGQSSLVPVQVWLPKGQNVSAIYSGDYVGFAQVGTPSPPPIPVTLNTDNNNPAEVGSLSYAIAQSQPYQTIQLQLSGTQTLTLTHFLTLKATTGLKAPCNAPVTITAGSNIGGGLTLGGNNSLQGLIFPSFKTTGVTVKLNNTHGNIFRCTVIHS